MLKKLVSNVTVREMLLLTFVVALSIAWLNHQRKIRTFTRAYARLQGKIGEFDAQKKKLHELEIRLSNESDVLRIVQQHNTLHPQLSCGLYFEPSTKSWHAAIADELPHSPQSRRAKNTPHQAVVQAMDQYDQSAAIRFFFRVRNLVGQPCAIHYDESAKLMRIEVPLSVAPDQRDLDLMETIANRKEG